jgi:hypothetical protein
VAEGRDLDVRSSGSDVHKDSTVSVAFFTRIAGGLFVFSALIYCAGWTYLHQYYRTFGVELSDLNIPWYNVSIYAFPVVFSGGLYNWIAIAIVLAAGYVLQCGEKALECIKGNVWIRSALGTIELAIVVGAAYWLVTLGVSKGNFNARRDANIENSHLPKIVEVAGKIEDGNIAKDVNNLNWALLAHTTGRYYFLRLMQKGGGMNLALPTMNVNVLVIPDTEIRRIELQCGIND